MASRRPGRPARPGQTARSGRPARPGRSGRSPQERARKAFARRQRARRWLTWRYVAAAVVLVLVAGFCVYALYFSSWLRVEQVEVVGNDLVSEQQLLDAAEVETGGPLVQVDLDAIERRVSSLAAVRSADVSRHWPHGIRIEVTERTPIAVLDLGSRKVALDKDGTSFPTPPKARRGLPLVRVGAGADKDALKEGARVVAALDPEVAALVGHVEVRTIDEILLHLDDGRLVRWGSADQSTDKARVLLELLDQKAQSYDVSVPGAPTIR